MHSKKDHDEVANVLLDIIGKKEPFTREKDVFYNWFFKEVKIRLSEFKVYPDYYSSYGTAGTVYRLQTPYIELAYNSYWDFYNVKIKPYKIPWENFHLLGQYPRLKELEKLIGLLYDYKLYGKQRLRIMKYIYDFGSPPIVILYDDGKQVESWKYIPIIVAKDSMGKIIKKEITVPEKTPDSNKFIKYNKTGEFITIKYGNGFILINDIQLITTKEWINKNTGLNNIEYE
ncbi:MAG: hypothetical protein FWG29_08505 [Treponema sp.]|nr:hypothetical protein [Treponema sp.]